MKRRAMPWPCRVGLDECVRWCEVVWVALNAFTRNWPSRAQPGRARLARRDICPGHRTLQCRTIFTSKS